MDLNSPFNDLQIDYQINPYPSLADRKKVLQTLKKGLQTKAYDLAEAINKDFSHRSVDETLFLEIFPTIKAIGFCLKNTKKWMRKRRRNVSWLFFPATAYVIPQSLGIVGNIVPWNYPVYLALVPAIYALAAGNRVMIKMSELSTNTGLALQAFIQSLGLERFICVINGDVEVSKQFSALPFAHLMFTGSTSVGKLIMKAASDNLTPVTLELGGKSPAILTQSMNPNYFKRLFMGKLLNAAQTCIAPDYLLVPEGWSVKIESEFKSFIETFYPQMMNNDNYSSIISPSHRQRLLDMVDDARNKGARVVQFGLAEADDRKMPFFLLFAVTDNMRVMQEELFGPILPVLTYKTLVEAVEYINVRPNPLALYYFGEDRAEKRFIQSRTLSGAFTVNETVMHIAVDDLPFGGVGYSGMGQYHGQEGFDTFSKLKPVMVQKRLSPITWLYPPYGKLMNLFLSWIGGIKIRK